MLWLGLVVVACTGDGDITESAPATSGPATTTATSTSTGAPTTVTADGAATSPSTPPDVDLTIHSVPLEEIYFDTFDGGAVPLSESTAELRASLLDAIPPVDQPVYGDVSAGDWLEPTDLVMGYVAGEEAFAYPFKILNFHEIVNDEIGGIPVLISYCPLCRSAIVYDRRVDGETLSFGNTSALYESDLVMVDRNTGSYWWQVAGSAIVGPLTGTALEALPSVVATWDGWRTQHPETKVLTRDTGFARPYERDSFAGYAEYVDAGQFVFPVSEASLDPRLPPSALVVGVTVDDVTVAYPVDGLEKPINDHVAGSPIVILPAEGGAAVYSAQLDDAPVEFEASANGRFVDVATGSSWTAAGEAVSGPLAGSELAPIPARTTFWFAFVGAFPDVDLRRG